MKKTITIALFSIGMIPHAQAQNKVGFSLHSNYYVGTSAQKTSTKNMLFFKNGIDVGISSWIHIKKRFGLNLQASYLVGSNDEKEVAAYAKMKDIVYTKFSYLRRPPGGTEIIWGLSYILSVTKKAAITANLNGGFLLAKIQALQFLNNQGTVVKSIKTNATSFVFNPYLDISLPVYKNFMPCFKVGYSNIGGIQIGVGIPLNHSGHTECARGNCKACAMIGAKGCPWKKVTEGQGEN